MDGLMKINTDSKVFLQCCFGHYTTRFYLKLFNDQNNCKENRESVSVCAHVASYKQYQ